jgi:RNA 2',3'-cyclic 3'-phosphodiesterase
MPLMLRLFAALPVPDDVADAVTRIQRGLEGAKWSPRHNLHITLRFMGNVNERQAEDVDAALGEILAQPFELELAEVGTFGGDAPHAIWLGVRENPSLLALQKQCERACRRAKLAPDPRAYSPHLTICYLPRHPDLARVMAFQQHNNLFTAPSWTADRFYLYASHTSGPGPSRYSLEAEYPLTV